MKVWHTSEAAPLGEWVDATLIPGDPTLNEDQHEVGAWSESSFDLLLGTEVSVDEDTVPAELLDELLASHWHDK